MPRPAAGARRLARLRTAIRLVAVAALFVAAPARAERLVRLLTTDDGLPRDLLVYVRTPAIPAATQHA